MLVISDSFGVEGSPMAGMLRTDPQHIHFHTTAYSSFLKVRRIQYSGESLRSVSMRARPPDWNPLIFLLSIHVSGRRGVSTTFINLCATYAADISATKMLRLYTSMFQFQPGRSSRKTNCMTRLLILLSHSNTQKESDTQKRSKKNAKPGPGGLWLRCAPALCKEIMPAAARCLIGAGMLDLQLEIRAFPSAGCLFASADLLCESPDTAVRSDGVATPFKSAAPLDIVNVSMGGIDIRPI